MIPPCQPPCVSPRFMYNPGVPSAAEEDEGFEQDDFDFIEITNTGDSTLNLENFSLSGGVDFNFPNIDLESGGQVLLVEDEEAFEERYGPGLPVIGAWSGNLANGGEQLLLSDGATTVLNFTYEDGWYPSTDGDGASPDHRRPFRASAILGHERRMASRAAQSPAPPELPQTRVPIGSGNISMKTIWQTQPSAHWMPTQTAMA